MNKTLWIVVAIIVAVGGVYWYQQDRDVTSDEPIKIGGLFAQTGYAAFAGEASREGFLMAIEDSGMNVTPAVEDFGSDTAKVASAASKLVNVDQVPVVIGPEWAEFSEVATPIANTSKVVFISPWMESEEKLAPPYYFAATPSSRSKQAKIVEYMAKQGDKRIALVYSSNAWSLAEAKTFKEEIAKNGEVSLVAEYKFDSNQTDYRTEITKLKNVKADAIYSLFAIDNSYGVFVKQLGEMDLSYPIYTAQSLAESPVLRDRYLTYLVGQLYPASKPYKNTAAFNEKFEKRYGHKPGAITAATAYDMTTLVLEAFKDGARTSDEIRDYLKEVKNYEGYSNTITFNAGNQVANEEVVIKRVTESGSEIVHE